MTVQVLVQKCYNGIFKSDVCPRVDFQVQVQFLVVVAVNLNLPQNRRLDIALTTCYFLSLFGYQSFFWLMNRIVLWCKGLQSAIIEGEIFANFGR